MFHLFSHMEQRSTITSPRQWSQIDNVQYIFHNCENINIVGTNVSFVTYPQYTCDKRTIHITTTGAKINNIMSTKAKSPWYYSAPYSASPILQKLGQKPIFRPKKNLMYFSTYLKLKEKKQKGAHYVTLVHRVVVKKTENIFRLFICTSAHIRVLWSLFDRKGNSQKSIFLYTCGYAWVHVY